MFQVRLTIYHPLQITQPYKEKLLIPTKYVQPSDTSLSVTGVHIPPLASYERSFPYSCLSFVARPCSMSVDPRFLPNPQSPFIIISLPGFGGGLPGGPPVSSQLLRSVCHTATQ